MKSLGWGMVVIVALGGMLAYAWGEGLWTGRWRPSDAPKIAAARLKTAPLSIGDWDGVDVEFNESQLALGELEGYLHRVYTHRLSGDQVQILALCGRPGPVSVHTPDVCYRGLGFQTLSKPARRVLIPSEGDEPGAECWGADFDKSTPLGREFLRIGWTWLAQGKWQAPERPRFEFAQEPVLYKLYFIRRLAKEGAGWEDDAMTRLARDLLPMLARHLAGEDVEPAPASGTE